MFLSAPVKMTSGAAVGMRPSQHRAGLYQPRALSGPWGTVFFEWKFGTGAERQASVQSVLVPHEDHDVYFEKHSFSELASPESKLSIHFEANPGLCCQVFGTYTPRWWSRASSRRF